MPVPAPGTAQFARPPYALHMCLHLPAWVHYYRACNRADSWPHDTLSLVGAVHCVQPSGFHQIQFCRKGMPPTSLILPERHHVVIPPSLHNRVSIAATGFTRASVLVLAATYHPCHLRKWVRGLPRALPAAVACKLSQRPPATHPSSGAPPPDRPPSRPDIVTLNVQMSLRPKLRALDILIREYQYPLTVHVQEAGPLIVQRVHPLYHTIQAPAKVAGWCATLLYRAPYLTVTNHSAHPSGRALVTHFTVAGVTHCHANVYFSLQTSTPSGRPGLGVPLPPPHSGQGRCLDGGLERQLPLGPTPPSLPRPALRPRPAHARAPRVVPLAPPCRGPRVGEPARLRRWPRPHLPPDPLGSCPHHGGALRLQGRGAKPTSFSRSMTSHAARISSLRRSTSTR